MSKKEIFIAFLLMLAMVGIPSHGIYTASIAPVSITNEYPSYVDVGYVFEQSHSKIKSEKMSVKGGRPKYFFSPTIGSDQEIRNLKPGLLGTLILRMDFNNVNHDVIAFGNKCEYKGIRLIDGRFHISYTATVNSEEFWNYCAERVSTEIDTYIITLEENSVVTVKTVVEPLEMIRIP